MGAFALMIFITIAQEAIFLWLGSHVANPSLDYSNPEDIFHEMVPLQTISNKFAPDGSTTESIIEQFESV